MIGVLDYGSGNVRAFLNAYDRLKVPCMAVSHADEVAGVKQLILPGVGAFDTALRQFEESGLRTAVEQRVLGEGLPLLGICVGMQMLAHRSEEGVREGLGWIPGSVRHLPAASVSGPLRLPHMGWNHIEVTGSCGLLQDLPCGGRFYFLHSYFFDAGDAADVVARCHYGDHFTCAVQRRNIVAVQFHPEKSHDDGMRLLENFARFAP